jgi:predicted dehydrogenase
LKSSALLSGAAVAAPYLIPGSAFGANEKIVTGHIGVGGQGKGNMGKFIANAAAVCDVDKQRAAAAQKTVAAKNGKCDVYGDFRKLLERKDIDAVVISTPDHWHALTTVRACEAGKHVYCEKPLTHSVAEGRAMVNAARKHKRIVQTGSQQRSDDKFRTACELVRSGRLGRLERIEVGIPGCNAPKEALGPDGDPPPELDYEMWLGPAPFRPYNEKRVHYNFRFWLDYAGGQITNFGAHHLDIAHWGMGVDDSGPLSVEGTATFDPRFDVPATYDLTYIYPHGVKVRLGQKFAQGATFYGEKGKIYVTRGKLTSDPGEIIKEPLGDKDVHLYRSKNHHQDWLDCIKSGKLPICDVEIGHRTATACHLGNLCVLLKRKLQWDAAKEQIVGDDEANERLMRAYRAPWKL